MSNYDEAMQAAQEAQAAAEKALTEAQELRDKLTVLEGDTADGTAIDADAIKAHHIEGSKQLAAKVDKFREPEYLPVIQRGPYPDED